MASRTPRTPEAPQGRQAHQAPRAPQGTDAAPGPPFPGTPGAGPRAWSVAVLADDLTSAGDGAAPFREAGHPAQVRIGVPEGAPATTPAGVVAVDLGSRLLDEDTAAVRTRTAARAQARADLLIKTVDSTLRGHVAAEIRAAHAGSRRRAVLIAPAFPAEGRTTVDGVQHVHGVPVHETAFGRDPAHPVTVSDLGRLLPEAAVVGPDRLARLAGLVAEGGLVVCSATTDDDLDRIVAAVPEPGEVLWVGSPGLAAALARHHARTPPAPAGATPAALPAVRRPLVVVGSANPASRRQLDLLRGRPDVTAASAGDPVAAVESLRRTTRAVRVVHTPDEHRRAAAPRSLTVDLALVAGRLIADGSVDGLVLTGGETAVSVLASLGAAGIDLYDEPEPGIARGTLIGPRPLPVLIKAGGFGDEETLDRLCRLLAAPGTAPGDAPGNGPGDVAGSGTGPGDEAGNGPGPGPGPETETETGNGTGDEDGSAPGQEAGSGPGDVAGSAPGHGPETIPGHEPARGPAARTRVGLPGHGPRRGPERGAEA
ncbi:four-carbon acid sugar kinase family protein [Streptomyces sp. NPDC053755]|uniref:four-carbon acid sugar kinase family protein n=1 Tax=Streptomyces sp. NPDC053755 TaxID=3155815 RepID=UPI0034245ACE